MESVESVLLHFGIIMPKDEEALAHFGVKGMHWGQHKSPQEQHAALINSAAAHDHVSAQHTKLAMGYLKEAGELQSKGFDSAAAKRVYGEHAGKQGEWAFYGQNGQSKNEALRQLNTNLRLAHNQHVRQANHHSAKAARLRDKAAKIQHSGVDDPDEEPLVHFGVKGMHWGEHRAHSQAKSDAVEFTKAKLAYGQGAGNRRKLIGAKVAERSKNPHYKKAFEEHLAGQNLAKRASQARVGHNVRATTRSTAKTARGVHRSLTGGFGSVTLASAAIAGAIVLGRKTGTDKVLLNKASQILRDRGSQTATKAWLRSQGVNVLWTKPKGIRGQTSS